MIERVYILSNPEPSAPEGASVVGVVCAREQGGRRTDFYFAGNPQSAEHLVKLLKGEAV